MMGKAETVIKASLTGAVLAGPAANERGAGCCRRGHTLVFPFPPSPLLSLQTRHPPVASCSPPSHPCRCDRARLVQRPPSDAPPLHQLCGTRPSSGCLCVAVSPTWRPEQMGSVSVISHVVLGVTV